MQQTGPQPAQPTAGGRHGEPLVVHNTKNAKMNMQVLGYNRIFAALVAGTATGILGVTGFKGFLIFVAFQLANAAALFIKCGFAPDRYYQGWKTLFFSGLMSQVELLTFVLFWTLSNNLVYLF